MRQCWQQPRPPPPPPPPPQRPPPSPPPSFNHKRGRERTFRQSVISCLQFLFSPRNKKKYHYLNRRAAFSPLAKKGNFSVLFLKKNTFFFLHLASSELKLTKCGTYQKKHSLLQKELYQSYIFVCLDFLAEIEDYFRPCLSFRRRKDAAFMLWWQCGQQSGKREKERREKKIKSTGVDGLGRKRRRMRGLFGVRIR